MGAIIISGRQSVWGLDGLLISKIWVKGGSERAAISGFMRKKSEEISNKVYL